MSDKMIKIIRYSIVVLGITFIVIGIFRGEAAEVLKKATQICLSCIGIG